MKIICLVLLVSILEVGITTSILIVNKQEKEVKNRLRGMTYQGTLSSNKSLNRFVFAIGSAPIFSLYSVNKDNIDKSFEFVGGYPEYKTEDTGTTRSAQ